MGYSVQSLGQWQSFATTFTGYTVAPTNVVFRYSLVGKTCFYTLHMSDATTSTATTLTFTVPFTAKSGSAQYNVVSTVINNGTFGTTPGRAVIGAGTNVASVFRDTAAAAWTASGDKRIFMSGQFEID